MTYPKEPRATGPGAVTISTGQFALAILRMLPRAPRLVSALAALGRRRADEVNSIGLMIERQARMRPDAVALRFEDASWTYAEFNAWASRIAAVLRSKGVSSGDTVALMMGNCPELLVCVAATVKLGAVAGMINPAHRGDGLLHSLQSVHAKVVVMDSECEVGASEVLDRLAPVPEKLWHGRGTAPQGWGHIDTLAHAMPEANPPETRKVRLRDRCFYVCTSGTTGLPKAAVMTHLRWVKASIGMGRGSMQLGDRDVLYCPLPLYHNNALTIAWSSVVAVGATLALARKFSTTRFWSDVRQHRATSFIYIGELCRYLLMSPAHRDDLKHQVRVIVGNGLRPEIWDEFQSRFGINRICEFYGAGESNLAFVNTFNLRRTAGYSPMPYAIVAFDPDHELPSRSQAGRLQRVARGEVGLLLSAISDKTPFDGYTDAAATEAKILRDVFATGDAWFNTGDLVRDQGFRHIAFVDRMGDTFRWKGENVATSEVEGVLQACEGIAQAAVYGVQMAQADGRAGMAAVTLQAGAVFDPVGLARTLHERLPPYAVPLFVRLVGQQDVTTTFKVRKVELKRQGYDMALVSDPIFFLADRERGYVALDEVR